MLQSADHRNGRLCFSQDFVLYKAGFPLGDVFRANWFFRLSYELSAGTKLYLKVGSKDRIGATQLVQGVFLDFFSQDTYLTIIPWARADIYRLQLMAMIEFVYVEHESESYIIALLYRQTRYFWCCRLSSNSLISCSFTLAKRSELNCTIARIPCILSLSHFSGN